MRTTKISFMRVALIVVSLFWAISLVSAQTFKVVIARFQDRTGKIEKKEAEASGGVTAGAVAGQNAAAVAASGQYSASTMESGKGDLGSQASDIFTSELVKTGKFSVLDGNMFAMLLLDSTQYKGNMAEAAKAMGAHYLLTGTVTQAGVSESGGSILGFGGKSVKGEATISVTLTNVVTSEVVLADNAEGTESVGGAVIFGGQVGGKKDLGLLLSSALHDAVKNCVPKIAEATGELTNYPIECDAALNEGKIYLSKGKDDGVALGDEFEIIGIGKTVVVGAKKIQQKIRRGMIVIDEAEKDYASAPAGEIKVEEGDKAVKVVKKKESKNF